ncbi:uncharacterized protein APUU_31040S [Aspergillus puulaauensis]|uniref:Uncharacterized protein n=1 Tax=Aspergillus puulaauensis TaxID=1220207 RepID=A0A7R7XK42_9EURO|nr:uncharacterized protein APUU_31040S [Aspergillus puulaauensis]BCS22815.1 hypothetical protein APUU_31040S [Aspergillus puulaauensis]
MANGYSRLPGELNAIPKSRNRSQTTVGLPPTPSPQKKRASSYYPPRSSDFQDENNPDPFYLEHSLSNTTGSWGSCQQGLRNARAGEDIQQYFMLSVVKAEPVVKATEQLSFLSKQARDRAVHSTHPYAFTPLNRSQVTLATEPSSPERDTKSQRSLPNASSETVIMPPRSHEASSLRGKPLPSLPAAPRPSTAHPSKKQPPSRLAIEPSMISPPSLINPVTLEPHRTHFDQALFIPANECPSPVPSPGPPSPSVDRPPTVPSTRERPSTSTSEMYPEQSVWESDSDNEDGDPRSLSRKPMDTLKKVRSRVQLRVAKSNPKLQNNPAQVNNAALEKSSTIPDHLPHERCPSSMKTAVQTRSGRDILRPTAHQTLRLVAPSTTSLVNPRSRRNSAKSQTYGIDRSTAAAAIQAKSRRRQRSTSPETSMPAEREKMCTFCREERSDKTIHQSLTLSRPPLYKRLWESLRVLGCHGDITPPRPRKGL